MDANLVRLRDIIVRYYPRINRAELDSIFEALESIQLSSFNWQDLPDHLSNLLRPPASNIHVDLYRFYAAETIRDAIKIVAAGIAGHSDFENNAPILNRELFFNRYFTSEDRHIVSGLALGTNTDAIVQNLFSDDENTFFTYSDLIDTFPNIDVDDLVLVYDSARTLISPEMENDIHLLLEDMRRNMQDDQQDEQEWEQWQQPQDQESRIQRLRAERLAQQDREREGYLLPATDETRNAYYEDLHGKLNLEPDYRQRTIFDSIGQEDVIINDFITEDNDNLVFIVREATGPPAFFTSSRRLVSQQLAIEECDDANTRYISLSNIGYHGVGMSNYEAAKQVILRSNYQIFGLKRGGNTGKLITHEIRHFGDNFVSGFHCQEGTQHPYYQLYVPRST